MKQQTFVAAFAAALTLHTAIADTSTNDVLEAESAVALPSFEASAFYSSMKIERGLVENPESVFGYDAEIEWYGIYGGVEACYDMTDINERAGRYNEIASFLGYGYTFYDLTAKAAYVYEACAGDEGDTQEVEFELEYETPWVTPYAEMLLDVWRTPGAFYGAFGLMREWEMTEGLALVTSAGFGVGNARRNEADFERNAVGCREMRVGASLDIEVCPHVKLVPGIDLYDSFTEAQREVYDKYKGFAAVGWCRLAVDF